MGMVSCESFHFVVFTIGQLRISLSVVINGGP